MEFEFNLLSMSMRGPRVRVRIRGLSDYLVYFNSTKIYREADPRYALGPCTTFLPAIDSGQRKTLWARLRRSYENSRTVRRLQ